MIDHIYELYRQALLGDTTLRAIVAKEITKYNKQRRLDNESPFNPLLLIRDTLPFYYDYLMGEINDFDQFLNNFNYRIRFDTAIRNTLGNHVNLINVVQNNINNIQLFLFDIPVETYILENNWGSFVRAKVGNMHIYLNDPNIYLNLHT